VHSRISDGEPGVHVHPGLRTTWLDGPRRSDGTVDYVEFVRAERSRGVTNENDLAPILSLCLEKPLRGVPPASDRAPPPAPVVSWFSWTVDHHLEDEVEESEELDWLSGRVDGPHAVEIRQWLAAIGPGLDLIQREATTRDRWYQPPEFNDLACDALTRSLRTIVPCYCMRAAGRSADGDVPKAVDDLSTAYELIRRWRGWDGLDGYLSILACEGYLASPLAAIARSNMAWKCADFRRVDAALPRTPRDEQIAEFIPWERLAILDLAVEPLLASSLQDRVDGANEKLRAVMGELARDPSDKSGAPHPPLELRSDGRHDVAVPARFVDALLERIHERFDARVAVLQRGFDWEQSIESLRALRSKADSEERAWKFHWDFWRRHTVAEDMAVDPEAGAVLLDTLSLPLWQSALEATVSATVETDAARLQFALACFKNEFGRVPNDLAELTAACFDAPARDRLYGEPLGWAVRADGTIEVHSRGAPLAARLKAQHAKPR
jgi:hypothetical protein